MNHAMMMKKNWVIAATVAGSMGALQAEDWKKSVDFGLSVSKGNTDSTLVRTTFKTEKEVRAESYFAELGYSYGEEDGEANENELTSKLHYKNNFSGKNFYGVQFAGRRDTFADIDYRFSLNATYGYYWIDTPETTFSTEFGLGLTVEDKGEGREEYLNGLFEQDFEHQLNPNATVFQSLSFAPRLDNISDYRVVFEAGLKTQVTESMSFKMSLENRYESEPAPGKESNDLKVIAGLSYAF